jgi:hypothetical protein
MKILYVWGDQPAEFNCSWHRAINPALALRRAGKQVELIHCNEWEQNGPRAQAVTEPADLIIFQRNCFGPAVPTIIDWASKGKRICIDVDDNYRHMDEVTGSPSWKLWRMGLSEHDGKTYQYTPTPLQSLEDCVKLVGHLSTPSRVLCDDWADYAVTHYVPNYLDLRIFQRRDVFRKEPGKVYIGWGGSHGHMKGWHESGVIEAMNQLAAEDKRLVFVTMGEAGMRKRLKVSAARLIEMEWRPYAQYPDFLTMLDVGVIPLAGEYDRGRSNLKSLEYTAIGLPWAGSDLEPNRLTGTGLLTPNTIEGWYKALSGILQSLPTYQYEAMLNRRIAADWGVDENVDALVAEYERMMQ